MTGFVGYRGGGKFSPERVLDPYRRQRRRWLFRNAGYIRTIARRSMRRRKKPALPGEPPSIHDGALKAGILFAVGNEKAVIGAVLAKSRAAAALEHGGLSSRITSKGKRKRFVVQAFPFMRPALAKAAPQLPQGWRGVIR